MAFLFIVGSFGALLVGWLGVVAAGCISQDTYLLYDILYLHLLNVEKKGKQIMENQCYHFAP